MPEIYINSGYVVVDLEDVVNDSQVINYFGEQSMLYIDTAELHASGVLMLYSRKNTAISSQVKFDVIRRCTVDLLGRVSRQLSSDIAQKNREAIIIELRGMIDDLLSVDL